MVCTNIYFFAARKGKNNNLKRNKEERLRKMIVEGLTERGGKKTGIETQRLLLNLIRFYVSTRSTRAYRSWI